MRRWRAACAALFLISCSGRTSWLGATASASESQASASSQAPAWHRSGLLSAWNRLRGDEYPLDEVERWLSPGERVTCDPKGLVSYRGTSVRYAGSVLVDPAFRQRLERFETVVAETAREVYGREPRLLRHYGAFSCRATRNRKHVVSEHALGNALDLVGFDFGAATKQQPLPSSLPKQLRAPFQVRVGRHWSPPSNGSAAATVHARFLALLTERLSDRGDIFRCMFGPGHGGHDDHLHLDAAPYRYVDL